MAQQARPQGTEAAPTAPSTLMAARAAVIAHREDVVRRLLAGGLSPATLAALLPDRRELIARVAAEHAVEQLGER